MHMIRNLFAILTLMLSLSVLPAPTLAQRTAMNYQGAYVSGTTYQRGDTVASGGITYVSLIVNNVGNTPASSPTDWCAIGSAAATYTLPTATSSILGGVKPDGTTISNTAGAIAVATPVTSANVVSAIAGQAIAPSSIASTGTISSGATPPTACGSASGCFAVNESSSTGTPTSGQDYLYVPSATHLWTWSLNGGTETSVFSSAQLPAATPTVAGTVIQVVNTSFTTATSSVSANSCDVSATQVAMTGVTTGMVFGISASTDTSTVVGWGSTGGLILDVWPTAGYLNYKRCNQTASTITTPGAVTFNVSAR